MQFRTFGLRRYTAIPDDNTRPSSIENTSRDSFSSYQLSNFKGFSEYFLNIIKGTVSSTSHQKPRAFVELDEMLKPKVLSDLLKQETTGGIISTIILKSNGSLLAFAGSGDKEARVTAAIASSIWNAYHSNIKQCFHAENLNFVLMDCDDGKVAITSISDLLLCLYSKKSVGLGLLKAKTQALAKYVEGPLSELNRTV